MLKLRRFVFFLVDWYKKLKAVAKLLRHSPKKMDFHLKTHFGNPLLHPRPLLMLLLVALNVITKYITTLIREREG